MNNKERIITSLVSINIRWLLSEVVHACGFWVRQGNAYLFVAFKDVGSGVDTMTEQGLDLPIAQHSSEEAEEKLEEATRTDLKRLRKGNMYKALGKQGRITSAFVGVRIVRRLYSLYPMLLIMKLESKTIQWILSCKSLSS
jgi:hypothetical protein